MMNALEKIFEELEEATFQEDAPIYEGLPEPLGRIGHWKQSKLTCGN